MNFKNLNQSILLIPWELILIKMNTIEIYNDLWRYPYDIEGHFYIVVESFIK